MKLNTVITVFLVEVYVISSEYITRPCGQDLSNLWLDVVAVVDNSQGMTNDGLTAIAANIASVFSEGTKIGTNSNDPRTTRLGLVTYSSKATKNAYLDKFQSIDDLYDNIFTDLATVSQTDDSNLETGLEAAEEILEAGKNEKRKFYKKLILIYASTFNRNGEAISIANRLKSAGTKLVTVAYDQGGGDEQLADGLAQISSPRFNFTNNNQALIGNIQMAMLEANCFCAPTWTQYRQYYSDSTSPPGGVCIQPVGLTAVWRAARISCANRFKNSYLADEFTQHKHDFIFDSIKNTRGFQVPYSYHIGLTLSNGSWSWDRPNGWEQPVVQHWFGWDSGFPISTSSRTSGANFGNGSDAEWQNIGAMNIGLNYVCETATCDTDNYCSTDQLDEI
ncbi:Protein CBG15368 [Caenorhabditis briggsae]|uniref:Protein CBG15368 n=1 Tax=Caenorhabditis briggsae TaxID=6238 RepID=A8XM19_CAEBR|nr:Protein CBG15368 [Caenorhabditis briggsae]CAP33694.2 Protein CBG15368 [Caenorhabditis briggsae]